MDRASLGTLERETLEELLLRLMGEHAALREQVEALRRENAELRARLGRDSSNSSRPPSSDPPGTVRPKAAAATRRAGGQPGHPGHHRELLPPERVDQVVVLVPVECTGCGAPLASAAGPGDPAAERQQVLELPPLAVEVTEYRLAARRCRACGRVTRASAPAAVEASSFGPRLQAVVALLSGRYRVSRREVVQLLADLWGAEVSLGTVTALEQATGAALGPVFAEAQAAARHERVANLDETGWREGRQRAWLWTMVTATLTVFVIAPRRVGDVARALLGTGWRGVVGSDRFSGYAWLPVCWRQVCWAHLKRDFTALVDRGGAAAPIGEAALAVEREVFELWHRFRRGELDRASLRRELEPHQAALWRVLEAGANGGEAKAAGLCRKLLKLWPALWTFARVEGVEPANSADEQGLRPAVLWRQGSVGTHSAGGSRFAERMLTVTASCRQQGRNLLEFLVEANRADRLGATPPSLVLTTG